MTIFRVVHDKNNPYLTINTTIAVDDRLSYKAKGIWFYAFSRKDDWQFNKTDLNNRSTDGDDSVSSGLKELEKFGYLYRKCSICPKTGKLQGWDWYFFETSKSPEEIQEMLTKGGFSGGREIRPTSNPEQVINESLTNIKKRKNEDSFILSIEDIEKIRNILKPYEPDEAVIKLALRKTPEIVEKALVAADQYIKKNNIEDKNPTLNKAIFEEWKPNKNKEDIFEENKEFSKTLIEFEGQPSKKGWYLNVCAKYIEFSFSSQSRIIEYDNQDFKKLVKNYLETLEFTNQTGG